VDTVQIVVQYWPGFWSGLATTLKLAGIVWLGGLFLGTLLGYLVDRYQRWLKAPFDIACFVLSGIPIIVMMVWAHYPLQVLMEVVIDPFFTASWVLTLVNVFAVAQTLSAALCEFPAGYITAAKVCGITRRQTFWKIKLPIIFRQVLPGVVTSQVVILQATLFASLISVDELFRAAQRINAAAYRPVEIYTALALLFLGICLPLNGFSIWFRSHLTKRVVDDY
jgi:polar amino acid transport system permease protein